MATAWITEYESMPDVNAQIAPEPGIASQTVTFTTTVASTAFSAKTRFIGFTAGAAYHFRVGKAPEATTSHMPMPASHLPYFIGVQPGDKIAFVAQ